MQNFQVNASVSNPMTLQSAAHATQAGSRRSDGVNPDLEFTVKRDDHPKARQLLDDLAQSKGLNLQYNFGVRGLKDFGDGNAQYITSNFSVLPDRRDGSYSPELQKKIGELRQAFQAKLHEAGISNHAR
ncbi:hypothetical protein [Pseudomonas sp. CBZ-4]|uniref:hypothetical protein n=1 Tax=Pseudomonas sp. CBZ-4 TaxID=1163065 RepID=UPI0012FB1852|nr:hypothetical protein [Pseudomonas sp. CBZ-4]